MQTCLFVLLTLLPVRLFAWNQARHQAIAARVSNRVARLAADQAGEISWLDFKSNPKADGRLTLKSIWSRGQ